MFEANLSAAMCLFADAVLDETLFEPALAQLSQAMGGRRILLVSVTERLTSTPEVETYAGRGSPLNRFLEDYEGYYHQFDPIKRRWPMVSAGQWMMEMQAEEPSRWSRGVFYQDCAKEHGIIGWGALKICEASPQSDGRHWALSLLQDQGQQAFDPAHLLSLAQQLPSLRRTLVLRRRFADLREAAMVGLQALHCFRSPMWILNGLGRLIFANQAAEQHMRSGRLMRAAYGELAPIDVQSQSAWKDFIAAAKQPGLQRASAIRLVSADGNTVLIRRLPIHCTESHGLGRLTQHQLLFLCNAREYGSAAEAERLQQEVYHFTAAEIRIGRYLLEDMTVAEIADNAGTKVSTVRTQVQAMLQKTGLRRQAELVRLLSAIYVVEPVVT